MPANPEGVHSARGVENIGTALAGVKEGLRCLAANDDQALRALGGVAVYAYTDGTGEDHYAGPEAWRTFREEWQNR